MNQVYNGSMRIHQRVGKIYGRLTVLAVAAPGKLRCKCKCGAVAVVNSNRIGTPEGARSCGCMQREFASALRIRLNKPKHGKFGTPIYNVWAQMIARCTNKQSAAYCGYGGRGILVCQRWRKFGEFYADMGDPPAGLSLDRKNNDGHYSKRNCRWATRSQQAKNRVARPRDADGRFNQKPGRP